MKFYPLLAVFCFLFLLGCDEEEPEVVPVVPADEVVKEALTGSLSEEADLEEFVAAFQNLNMEPEDVANGITIFAPADADVSSGGRSAATKLTSEGLKGHIVKDLISASNLNDGDTLVALNGKLLLVEVNGEGIRINGVLLTSKDLASDAKYVVHKIEEILEHPVTAQEPATVTVTVWNSLKWSAANPKGEPAAGATVTLYASQADYAAGVVLATAETNASGEAVFTNLEGGTTYYIVAQQGDMSNVFHRSAQPVSGVYVGFSPDGIFQSQAEVDGYAMQSGASPGNIRYADVNGDGVINLDDQVAVPQLEATPVFSETRVEVIIGYSNNGQMVVRDGPDALQKLAAARKIVNSFHKNLVMLDGILSDDADCTADPSWCAVDNFAFNSTDPKFGKIWYDAYAAVGKLNLLLRDVPTLEFLEKIEVLGEAKASRAYIYLQMATYFGGIPLTDALALGDEFTSARAEVLAVVVADLEEAATMLPLYPSAGRMSLNTAKVLKARAAILNQDWATASAVLEEVMQSGAHTLMETNDAVFVDATNAEIIWDFSSTLPFGFSEYFYGRTFAPAVRLGEVYLMYAEAQLEMGLLESAINAVNMIRTRDGMAPATVGATQAELRTQLQETWQVDMSREGNRFANLVRWGIAAQYLGAKGYNVDIHGLLPVPQSFLDQHPNLMQNPGY